MSRDDCPAEPSERKDALCFESLPSNGNSEAAPPKSPGKSPNRLGWKLWDQALTEEIAREAKVDRSAVMYCDEHMDSTFHRLAKTFWRGSYERSMPIEGH